MPILNVSVNQVGQAGVFPAIIYILTNDTLAEVTTVGYLNGIVQKFNIPLNDSDMALVTTKTSPNAQSTQVGWLSVSFSNGDWSLIASAGPGDVILPTIANHLATYTDTLGTLSEDPTTAISGGNIQAGLSGTAGYLASFPATLAKGSLHLVGAASAGDTVTTITNASQAAARTYTIPDGGQSASNFLLTDNATTQTIATGSLALTVGNVTATAGNITAGSSGHAGIVTSFPGTAANGSLILAGVNAGGAFNTTISNSAMGQSTVYSLGDIGATTGGIVVATSAIRMKSVAGAAAAGGAAAQSFTDAFCTTGSNIVGNWNTQANPASVLTIVPGNGSFVVTSSANAGAGTFNYIITK
jgi:hypothetical protein